MHYLSRTFRTKAGATRHANHMNKANAGRTYIVKSFQSKLDRGTFLVELYYVTLSS